MPSCTSTPPGLVEVRGAWPPRAPSLPRPASSSPRRGPRATGRGWGRPRSPRVREDPRDPGSGHEAPRGGTGPTRGPAEGGHDERACGVPHPCSVPTSPSAVHPPRDGAPRHDAPCAARDGGGWRTSAPEDAVQRPPTGPRESRRPSAIPRLGRRGPPPLRCQAGRTGVGDPKRRTTPRSIHSPRPHAPWGPAPEGPGAGGNPPTVGSLRHRALPPGTGPKGPGTGGETDGDGGRGPGRAPIGNPGLGIGVPPGAMEGWGM